jgi:hypothetical protein
MRVRHAGDVAIEGISTREGGEANGVCGLLWIRAPAYLDGMAV